MHKCNLCGKSEPYFCDLKESGLCQYFNKQSSYEHTQAPQNWDDLFDFRPKKKELPSSFRFIKNVFNTVQKIDEVGRELQRQADLEKAAKQAAEIQKIKQQQAEALERIKQQQAADLQRVIDQQQQQMAVEMQRIGLPQAAPVQKKSGRFKYFVYGTVAFWLVNLVVTNNDNKAVYYDAKSENIPDLKSYGLTLKRSTTGFEVDLVESQGSAFRAGFRSGDAIHSVKKKNSTAQTEERGPFAVIDVFNPEKKMYQKIPLMLSPQQGSFEKKTPEQGRQFYFNSDEWLNTIRIATRPQIQMYSLEGTAILSLQEGSCIHVLWPNEKNVGDKDLILALDEQNLNYFVASVAKVDAGKAPENNVLEKLVKDGCYAVTKPLAEQKANSTTPQAAPAP